MHEMMKVGKNALLVAGVGVIAPLALGILCALCFAANTETGALLFAGATLGATSISLTARIFKDMKLLDTREAKLVLGAAVLDDILGLILLSVISGLALHGHVEMMPLFKVIVITAIFLGVIVLFGERIAALIVENLLFLEPPTRRMVLPLIIC